MEMELIIPDKIAMMADLLGCDVLVIRTIQRFIKLGAVGDALDYATDTERAAFRAAGYEC